MSVTVTVTGGPSATVPFSSGMTALNALEAMWNQIITHGVFTFGVQYGGSRGYLLLMVDDVYNTSTSPLSYWMFYHNGQPVPNGVSTVTLNDGDQIVFTYEHERISPRSPRAQ